MDCFQNRETISRRRIVSVMPNLNVASTLEPLTPIIFRGAGMCTVSGAESGQVYCFTALDPEQMIDANDVDALLETGLFRLKS